MIGARRKINIIKLKKRAGLTRGIIILLVLINIVLGLGLYGAFQIKPIKEQARTLKEDVKVVASYIAQKDMDAAQAASEKMKADNAALRDAVTTPYWKVVAKFPVVGPQLKSAIKLTEILDVADDSIIVPMIALLRQYPTDNVLVDGSLNGEAITAYVGYIDSVMPVMNDLSAQMKDVNVSMVDSDGKIGMFIEAFIMATDVLNEASGRVLTPLSEQLQKYPTDSIKTETGFNNEALRSYLMFIDNMFPEVQYVTEYIDTKDFSRIDPNGKIKEYTGEISTLVGFLSNASNKVIRPLIDQLEECPLDNIKADDGFNVVVINEYLTFIEGVMPGFKEVSQEMQDLELAHMDANGKITEYKEKLDRIITIYDEGEEYLPLIHTILGDGSDKFYLVAAQNSAEIRASGGFPGSIGSLSIKDGIMTIGDFSSVYKNYYYGFPEGSNVTAQERELFSGMPFPWDADFCPDFERVGKIWALGYEARKKVHVDGVISMTPAIIQELLKFLGDIELSDGTVLTGENATSFLQHEVYVKYQNEYSPDNEDNDFVDDLFAETAKKTMSILVSEFKVGYMPEFLNVLHNGIEDRIIMFWFEDEESQEVARRTGSSGGLNRDKDNPAAGVYFNLVNACKMGWYIDLFVECGDAVKNADGSCTYNVTVTVSNIITYAEAAAVSGYITTSGYVNGIVYFFAPAGGTVSDFSSTGWNDVAIKNYSDLDLGYLNCILNPGNTITVTYKVTTAPGVDTPLTFSVTPTLTNYRD